MVRATVRVLVLLVVALPAWAQPGASVPTARVLALYADSRHVYAVQQVEDALRTTLASDGLRRIEYYSEFMAMVRFGAAADREVLRAFLQEKYRTQAPDVVLAVGLAALEFLLAHRQTLFAGSAIVHAGLTHEELQTADVDDRVVGLTGAWDPARAVDLARRLQPDLRHVVVVGGVSSRDRRLLASVTEAAARLSDQVSFTWLTSHSIDELKTGVAALPDRSAIVFVAVFEDAQGRHFVPRDVLEQLAPVAAAPIYGPFESYVGYGVVGGTMETWRAVGEESARGILRILDGTPPSAAFSRSRMPLATIVDWRQLQRWQIRESILPAGADVRFKPPSLWDAYRWQVLTFAGIGLAQLLLIAALAVSLQRRRVAEATRREAEARASQLRDELAHAARVTLLGELAATLAHEINQPLAAILSNAQATRRWLSRDEPDLGEIRAVIDDIIADDKRAGEIIHRMRALLKKGDTSRTRFDLAAAIRDVSALLHGELIAADVSLRVEVPESALLVDGDEVATQQVLLNLLLNGIQSIKEADATIRQVLVQAERVDGLARVVVHDTGRGVSQEMRDKVFEPFFTTKSRGLGVGLAICRRIAEAHGGTLELAPAGIGGATFVLAMPTVAAA